MGTAVSVIVVLSSGTPATSNVSLQLINDGGLDLGCLEGQAHDLVDTLGVDEEVSAEQLHQLAQIHLGNEHLGVGVHDFAEVGRERIEVLDVSVSNPKAPSPG